ncbi:MAG TPA: hypothetical protein VGR61_07195, partial [Candidatus Dormibacteraeota bacterium]|nr:hypothetical protein [Candidatus Dormibacteraeota bacterium]
RTAVVLLLLYPGAVFLTFTYSEALALLFFVAAALAARRRRWWLAGALGALAAATRPTGVVIIVLLMVEYLMTERPRRLVHVPVLFIPILGTAAYCAYLWFTVGDPIAFIHSEQPFGRGLGILPVEFANGHWLTAPSFAIWVVAMAAALWSIRVVRPSYGAFATALLLAAPLTGAFGSTSRYLLLAWPVFVMLARYVNTERRVLVTASLFSIFLAFFLLLFVHGYWVA